MAGFVPMRGEFATVQAEIIQWGQSARVLERQGRALRLDQRLDWSVGTEFRAFLRDEEGSPTASLGCSRGIADDWQIGRAHVYTPDTNAHLVCRLLLDKKNNN